jgi:hypothetical protein
MGPGSSDACVATARPHRLRARIGRIGQDAVVSENLIEFENLKPFRMLNLMKGKLRR